MIVLLTKGAGGGLAPADEEAQGFISKLRPGETVAANVRPLRRPHYFRRFRALVNFAWEQMEGSPATIARRKEAGLPGAKSLETFTDDLLIACGYYRIKWHEGDAAGGFTLYPRAIDWDEMTDGEMYTLYGRVLERVLAEGMDVFGYDEERLARVVDELAERVP